MKPLPSLQRLTVATKLKQYAVPMKNSYHRPCACICKLKLSYAVAILPLLLFLLIFSFLFVHIHKLY